jgi:hypothetical protein
MMKLISSLGHGECDGHTVHKLSQRRLTADLLAPRESDCSWMRSKVFPDWLPVTSRRRFHLSRYSKCLNIFRTGLVRRICGAQSDADTSVPPST